MEDRLASILEVLVTRAASKAELVELDSAKKKAKLSTSNAISSSEFQEKFCLRPSVEQVDEQWARALCKKGLALDVVDDPEFRRAVLLTARCGGCCGACR